jgi:hypothetical protein
MTKTNHIPISRAMFALNDNTAQQKTGHFLFQLLITTLR